MRKSACCLLIKPFNSILFFFKSHISFFNIFLSLQEENKGPHCFSCRFITPQVLVIYYARLWLCNTIKGTVFFISNICIANAFSKNIRPAFFYFISTMDSYTLAAGTVGALALLGMSHIPKYLYDKLFYNLPPGPMPMPFIGKSFGFLFISP